MASRRTAISSSRSPECEVPKDVGEAIRTLIRWAGDDPDREGPARHAAARRQGVAEYAARL